MRHRLALLLAGGLLAATVAAAEPVPPRGLPDWVRVVRPAVVTLVAYNPDRGMPAVGTGFFVAADRVATCRHLLLGVDRAEARTADGGTRQVLGLVAEDRDWDLALLELEPGPPGAAAVAGLPLAVALPEEGESVFAIGAPLGLEWSVSAGVVSARRELPGLGVALQHTAPVAMGSSGSPLFNLRGEVVGVQAAVITIGDRNVSAGQNLNTAVCASRLAALRVGARRPLTEVARDLPADWLAPLNRGVDTAALRCLTRDDFAAATAFFEAAVQRTPTLGDAWFRLGLCHDRCARLPEAEAAYLKATQLDAGHATAWNNLGVVRMKTKRHGEAVEPLQAAVRLRPAYAMAYANLTEALVVLEHWAEAVDAGTQAVRADEKLANAHLQLGLALVGNGDRERARQELATLEKLDPGSAPRLRDALDHP